MKIGVHKAVHFSKRSLNTMSVHHYINKINKGFFSFSGVGQWFKSNLCDRVVCYYPFFGDSLLILVNP